MDDPPSKVGPVSGRVRPGLEQGLQHWQGFAHTTAGQVGPGRTGRQEGRGGSTPPMRPGGHPPAMPQHKKKKSKAQKEGSDLKIAPGKTGRRPFSHLPPSLGGPFPGFPFSPGGGELHIWEKISKRCTQGQRRLIFEQRTLSPDLWSGPQNHSGYP